MRTVGAESAQRKMWLLRIFSFYKRTHVYSNIIGTVGKMADLLLWQNDMLCF